MKMQARNWLGALATLALLAWPAQALDLGSKTEIHGFGGWAYGSTDGNGYLTGSEDGEYGNAEFFLNVYSQPTEKLSISAQVGWINDAFESKEVFDFAFAEYSFSDAFNLRMGRVKHPFGIYGEIQRVGTVRPFLSLPQSIYGPFGLIGNGYDGIGLTGNFFTDSGWGFVYDVYGGQLHNDLEIPNLVLFIWQGQNPLLLNDGISRFEETLDDMVGARINVMPPVPGLSFGVSGYTGTLTSQLVADGSDRTLVGAHLEYLWEGLQIRAEYMRNQQNEPSDVGQPLDVEATSYYLEVAYRLTDNWEVAARYDVLEQEIDSEVVVGGLPPYVEAWNTHEDLAFGVNYWFNSHFAIKASYHLVEGLTFARARFQDPFAALLFGAFDDETRLFQFGAQFSF